MNYYGRQVLESPLKDYVHHISFNQFSSKKNDEYVAVIPDGMTELVINLGSPYTRRKTLSGDEQLVNTSHIIGLKTQKCEVKLNVQVKAASIRFLPGALANFTKEDISQFSDQVLDANLIFGSSIVDLEDQLFESSNEKESIKHIEKYLLKHLKLRSTNSLIKHSLSNFYLSPDQKNLRSVAKSSAEYKQLERVFKHHVGINPKKMLQLINFNYTTKMLSERSEANLAQLAYSAGYYDQAHFNKKFKEYSGFTPNQYLEQKNDLILVNQNVINSMFRSF